MSVKRTSSTSSPWGAACGLLAACAITLSGVLQSLSPETILFRAVVGGVVAGVMLSVAAGLCRRSWGIAEDDERG